jgi:lipoprotein-anchoring transpeptidase ErfK/SrfK
VRDIDAIANQARAGRYEGYTRRRAATPRPKPPKPREPWRPRWWPKGLPAAAGGARRAVVVIKLKEQRLYFHDGRKRWLRFSVSTGLRRATPRGSFRVVTKVRNPDWSYRGQEADGGTPGNPLGVCWLGLGMPRSWRGAPVGMHGTNMPWLIGRPASHGCIRLRNEDALALYRGVPLGCPVWIVP